MNNVLHGLIANLQCYQSTIACTVSLPSRWGLTFLLCLVVAIPTTVINFVPNDYPLNISLSHLYEPGKDTTHGLEIQNLLLLLLATFVQVQYTSTCLIPTSPTSLQSFGKYWLGTGVGMRQQILDTIQVFQFNCLILEGRFPSIYMMMLLLIFCLSCKAVIVLVS